MRVSDLDPRLYRFLGGQFTDVRDIGSVELVFEPGDAPASVNSKRPRRVRLSPSHFPNNQVRVADDPQSDQQVHILFHELTHVRDHQRRGFFWQLLRFFWVRFSRHNDRPHERDAEAEAVRLLRLWKTYQAKDYTWG